MELTTLLFLGFFAAVALLNYTLPRVLRPYCLLAASYLFYCWGANDRLLDCELNAMLAWLAMDTRSRSVRSGARGIVWYAEPDATVVAPAWRITTAEDERCLLFRPALGRDTLDRLLRRTGGRAVEFPTLRR